MIVNEVFIDVYRLPTPYCPTHNIVGIVMAIQDNREGAYDAWTSSVCALLLIH